MKRIKTRIVMPQDIWEADKRLLKLSKEKIDIDWNAQVPSDKDAYAVVIPRQNFWYNPSDVFSVNESSVHATIDKLTDSIESVFEASFKEMPDIEILKSEDYLGRVQELNDEVNAAIGYGSDIQQPPGMAVFPSHGKVIIPDVFIVREYLGRETDDISNPNVKSHQFPWDKNCFETTLCEELCHCLFRQIRGEWKEAYIKSIKAVGAFEKEISNLNEALADYVADKLIENKYPQWALHRVADKILTLWRSYPMMAVYMSVCSLINENYNPCQIAMVDITSVVDGNHIGVDFCQDHPYNSMKQEMFERKNDSFQD